MFVKLSLVFPLHHSFLLFLQTESTPGHRKSKRFGRCWYSISRGEEERVHPLYPGGFYEKLESRVVLCGKHVPLLEVHSDTMLVPNNHWDKETLSATELEGICPFLKQIRAMKDQVLTEVRVVASFIRR